MDSFTHSSMSKAQHRYAKSVSPNFSNFDMNEYDGPESGASYSAQTRGGMGAVAFKSKDFGLKGLGAWNKGTVVDFGDSGGTTPMPSSFGN